MSQKTIEFKFRIGATLTNVTSVVLRDPTNSFGVRRTDTDAVLVVSGTPLTHISTGIYRYTFTEPAPNLSYEYWIEYTQQGNIRRERQVLQGAPAGVSGNVAMIGMGVQMVSCGDAALAEFLNTWAASLWAMEMRLGVALDLKYKRFTLALIGLALDRVRTLIDTETMHQEMQETGYSNSSNSNSAGFNSSRTRTESSTQSASSSQSFTRSATRTSSSQMGASATHTSTRTGVTTDDSTQTQTSRTTRTTSQHLETVTTPLAGRVADYNDYKVSDTTIINNSEVEEWVRRKSDNILFVGQFSGQEGILPGGTDADAAIGLAKRTVDHGIGNTSTATTFARDLGSGATNTETVVSGKGKNASGVLTGGGGGSSTTDETTIGTGSRTNAVHRSSSSSMTGSATQTASGTMESASHDEQHRASESAAHSESLGHAESSGSALAHRESLGASSMQGTSSLDRQYYSQIFQSLQQMWKDTVEQIKQLEKQVQMTARVIIQKLPTRTPQATLTKNNPFGNSYITSNPYGTPFGK